MEFNTRTRRVVRGAGAGIPLVNGTAGVVVVARGRVLSVMGFTVAGGRIVAIDVLQDPDRLARLDITALDAAAGG